MLRAFARRLPWLSKTPFGAPVVPDVYISSAMSLGSTPLLACGAPCLPALPSGAAGISAYAAAMETTAAVAAAGATSGSAGNPLASGAVPTIAISRRASRSRSAVRARISASSVSSQAKIMRESECSTI